MTPIHTFMKEMEQISIMKISSWVKYATGVTVAAAMLAACSSGGSSSLGPSGVSPNGHLTGGMTLAKLRDAALTMPHYVQPNVHQDHGQSLIRIDKKKKGGLLYVADDETDDVYVYDYPSGTSVGTLTGFSGPYGECTDSSGDVYIANFDDEDAVEYGYGGKTVLNTYDQSGGTPIGCSVDSKGDVAVTSFDPGEVTVFAGGDPSKGTTYSASSSCYYMWTMGYDSKGNLIAVGENEDGGREYCALMSGASSITALSFSGTIDFPGGTKWDGEYIALGDQEAGGTYVTGVYPVTLSGSTLTAESSEVDFDGSCYSDYNDDVNPFFTNGKTNISPDKKSKSSRANTMVGPDLWCESEGKGGAVYTWAYPAGGDPSGGLKTPSEDPYGAAVVYAKKKKK